MLVPTSGITAMVVAYIAKLVRKPVKTVEGCQYCGARGQYVVNLSSKGVDGTCYQYKEIFDRHNVFIRR